MPEPTLLMLCAGLVTVSVVAMAWTLARTARDVRRFLQRANALLPGCHATIQAARETLAVTREVLTRTNNATRHVESFVQKTCEAAAGVVEHVTHWRSQAQSWWSHRFGNGVTSNARRKH